MNETLMREMAERTVAKLAVMLDDGIPFFADAPEPVAGVTVGLRIETKDGEVYDFKLTMEKVSDT